MAKSKANKTTGDALVPASAYPMAEMLERFGGKFKVSRAVTVPQLKQAVGETVGIKILTVIKQSKPLKNVKAEKNDAGQPKPPPFVANVTNLEDGAEYSYIFNAVVKDNIEELYPKETYVGKMFAISKGPKALGKNYNQFHILELTEA